MRQLPVLLFFLLPYALCAQSIYLHCGQMFDARSGTLRGPITVVVEGENIRAVENGYVNPPAGAKAIDLKDLTLLPGYIDCHVHLEWEQSRNTYTEKFTLNEADIAFRSAVYARKTLHAGFTTVRDLGGQGVNIALRKAVNAGLCEGPRIYTAGQALSITGGHGDPTNGGHWDLYESPEPEDGVADGPDECRTAVRSQVKRGADWIKVCATGGVLSLARDGRLPHYASDELETIVRTAHDLGIEVAAHAHGDAGARRAIQAGVRSIEHGTFMSDSTLDMMKARGVWYVPTLTAGWAVSDSAQYAKGFFPEVVRVKAMGIGPKITETLTRAYKKGVPIAFGTDAGVCPHGTNNLEFAFMAKAGMRPADILRAATLNAAEMLGIANKTGSIEAGKWADLVAVKGNPLQDIQVMTPHPAFVMKGGKVVAGQ
jgi:imidazolonepropionase-like amidohydrolase